jgi:hypothetical protein
VSWKEAIAMRPPVSVILVREYAEQVTGSGCCGKLEGDNALLGGESVFERTRRIQHDFGILHRAVREFYPAESGRERVAVVTVDPRNQLYLVPKLWSDVLFYRPGWRNGLKTMLQWFSTPAVIVNGRVVSGRNQIPDPDALCHRIHELLAERTGAEF